MHPTDMTLRDWFAGQALAGLAAREPSEPTSDARLAYKYADAMLDARTPGAARGEAATPDPARVILERLLRHMVWRDGHYRLSSMAVARARREAGLDEDGSAAPSPPDDIRAALEAVANFSREDFTDGRPNGIWLVGESVVRQARRALGRPEE